MWKKIAANPAIRFLSSLKLAVFGLLLIVILVIWGTVYQARFGLYQAQVNIFQSWLFLAGGILPLPGMLFAGALMGINLLAAVLFRLTYRLRNLGLILVHYGLVLLLFSGFFSLSFSRESFLLLEEGESSNVSLAYRQWELALAVTTAGGKKVTALDADRMRPGQRLPFADAGLELAVDAYWPNCRAEEKEGLTTGITPLPPASDPEANRPGARLRITGAWPEVKTILLYGGSAAPFTLGVVGQNAEVSLRLRRFPLPFAVRLIDFKKSFYPGSEIVRSYESLVEVENSGYRRRALISMNKPLRIGGLTIFQSSYSEGPNGRESSTLAVSENSGRLLPYIASALTFLGLAFHFLLKIVKSKE